MASWLNALLIVGVHTPAVFLKGNFPTYSSGLFSTASCSFISSGLSSPSAFLKGQVCISLAIQMRILKASKNKEVYGDATGRHLIKTKSSKTVNITIKNSTASTLGRYCCPRIVSDFAPRFHNNLSSFISCGRLSLILLILSAV